MGTNAKESTQLKTKSRSAPSTPSSSSQRKGLGPTESSDKDGTTSTQEKPIPNYLRPTISSGHNSKHQHSESPSRSPITKKSVEKSALPSSQSKDKARIHKSPLPKPSNSPNSTPDKSATPDKSSSPSFKTAKAATTTSASSKSSISKGKGSAGATKKKEGKSSPRQAAKVLSVESQSQDEELKAEGSPICDSAEKNEEVSNYNEEKQETILQNAASGENEASSSNEEGKDREAEGPNGALFKNEEAKEKGSPTVDNAANKLVAGKRDRVRALVGAFETVMELECQQSPHKGDKGKHIGEIQHMKEKEAETSQDIQDGETGQETQQVEVSQPKYEEQEEIMEDKAEEASTGSMWSDKIVVTESGEEGSKYNTEQESTKVSSNSPREVMGSEESKDASPKDGDSAAV